MENAPDCFPNRENQKPRVQNDFKPLDENSVRTLKRNPKIEFCRDDLLKLLSYLEGELQARDVVIATLKSERLKQYLIQNRHLSQKSQDDPVAALQRDSFASADHSRENAEMCKHVNKQLSSLDNLVLQQKKAQARVARALKEAEIRHHREIEIEVQNRKKFEKEYLKLSEILEAERNRSKQIALFLLAERKTIIMKYIEERKRSEDLAQILAEEKSRVDTMAEGLEEESKKSLQMEAELEKQLAQFYVESQQLKTSLTKQERKSKDLEVELEKSHKEIIGLRQQLNELRSQPDKSNVHGATAGSKLNASPVPSGILSNETSLLSPANNSSNPTLQCVTPMMTSIAKAVQPTATVSSVPVSGPMTGIARSVNPGQHVRYVMYSSITPSNTHLVNSGKHVDGMQSHIPFSVVNTQMERSVAPSATVRSATIANSPHPKMASSPIAKNHSNEAGNLSTVGRKHLPLGRGVPPPVPPNKPIVPPKKDGILGRKTEAVNAEHTDLKNSQIRTPILPPAGKVKLPNNSDKQENQVKNDLIAENPE